MTVTSYGQLRKAYILSVLPTCCSRAAQTDLLAPVVGAPLLQSSTRQGTELTRDRQGLCGMALGQVSTLSGNQRAQCT